MTDILAIDLATRTGWARGHVGAHPRWGSVKFGTSTDHNNEIFAQCMRWITQVLQAQKPDVLILEALLPPIAMSKVNATSAAALGRLSGLNAIVRATAHNMGVGEIAEASVGDIRAHFIGTRRMVRFDAKRAVMDRCKRLGWNVEDDNEADSLALWHYACSLIDPKLALNVTPLFGRTIRYG